MNNNINMNLHFQRKKRHFALMKPWFFITALMVIFYLSGISIASGQVTAAYNTDTKEVVIKNESNRNIVLFGKTTIFDESKKDGLYLSKNKQAGTFRTKKQLTVNGCGISFTNGLTKSIAGGSSNSFKVDKNYGPITYYFYEKESDYNIVTGESGTTVYNSLNEPSSQASSTRSNQTAQQPISQPQPVKQQPQQEHVQQQPVQPQPIQQEPTHQATEQQQPVQQPDIKQPTVKSPTVRQPVKTPRAITMPDKTNEYDSTIEDLITRSTGKTKSDSIELKRILNEAQVLDSRIEDEKAILKKVKTPCENCESLLVSYQNERDKLYKNIIVEINKTLTELSPDEIAQIEKQADSISAKFQGINGTLNNIGKLIDEKSSNTLTGWIGKTGISRQLDEIKAQIDTVKMEEENFKDEAIKKYPKGENYIESLSETIFSKEPYEKIDKYKDDLNRITIPYVFLYIIGILLLFVIAGIIFYAGTFLKNRKIKKDEKEKLASGAGGIMIEDSDADSAITLVTGLSEVRKKAGMDYYEIDMQSICDDTSIRYVYFSRKCILDINKFFSGFLKYDDKTDETGCFLVGRWDYSQDSKQYDISIETLVEPSDDAVYGEYILDFGAKIGITLNYAIENLCEKTGNEYVHTAWMHSHPGLGLFLSSQDLSVQSQLAHSQHQKRMLAIVIDSNSPDLQMVFFAPKHNGEMNNDKDVKQLLSLEALYQWAKTSPNDKKTQTGIRSYYEIPLSSEPGKLAKILFGGSAIIETDAVIMPDAIGLQGYFYGVIHPKEIVIDDFNDREQETGKPVSCFVVVPQLSNREVLMNYLPVMNRFDFSIIYCMKDGNIYVLSKNERKRYPDITDKIPSAPLLKMKEWTRRKR